MKTVGNASANPGSFRDPTSRVYEVRSSEDAGQRILRGLDAAALRNYEELSGEPFFQRALEAGKVVATTLLGSDDLAARDVLKDGWAGVLEHDAIPFVSYPYEWTFSMLRAAAVLQLELIEDSLEHGWTLKDCSSFNIQWIGARPVFIDIPSFEPWVECEPWVGYRQFCSMFLTPLLLRAHLGIDHLPLLRSYLDGIPPREAVKFFTGRRKLKKGVLSHIVFPAKVERRIQMKERDSVPIEARKPRKQSKAMVVGLVQSLIRLVKSCKIEIEHSNWSHYDKTHSYEDAELDAKKTFVLKHASARRRGQVWDIGCNTGTFSRIASDFCDQVIAIDGDHDAVEQLYLSRSEPPEPGILPLVMGLANISPAQGWAGCERSAFDRRRQPDLVLCLALIHHIRISANIPSRLFLRWLRTLGADVVLEFVNREDEMVVKLLAQKKEQYPDYSIGQFVTEAEEFFVIRDRQPLKGGKREIFFLEPKPDDA